MVQSMWASFLGSRKLTMIIDIETNKNVNTRMNKNARQKLAFDAAGECVPLSIQSALVRPSVKGPALRSPKHPTPRPALH